MELFTEYLAGIENLEHRARLEEVLVWVAVKYPDFGTKVAWNQPMFTDHGTFIIGFSTSKQHLLIAPEVAAINHFSEQIIQAGYDHTKGLMRIRWDRPLDYSLIGKIIDYNIMDKADCTTFWRK